MGGWHRTYSSPTRAALLADMARTTTRVSAARTELCRNQRQIMKPSKPAPKDTQCGSSLEEMKRRLPLCAAQGLCWQSMRRSWVRVGDGIALRQGETRPGRQGPQHRPACRSPAQNLSQQVAAAQCKQSSRTVTSYNYGTRYRPSNFQCRFLALPAKVYPPRHDVCREETSVR